MAAGKITKFPCKFCGDKFSSLALLDNHIELWHDDKDRDDPEDFVGALVVADALGIGDEIAEVIEDTFGGGDFSGGGASDEW